MTWVLIGVDPDFRRQSQRSRLLVHESLRMRVVGFEQHDLPGVNDVLRVPVVDHLRGQVGDPRVAVLRVVP